MSILTHLASLAIQGASATAENLTGTRFAGVAVAGTLKVLQKHFTDQSSELTKALERASTRAWKAVEVSLGKVALASGDDRAIRNQVQAYLEAHPLDGVDGHGPDFRAQCVAQLQAARKAGLLDRGKVNPADLARLLAAGLERAHARGILHRDVKPGNILVRKTPTGWQAKLIDFGLALRAKTANSTMKAAQDRTLAGMGIAGTIEYAAPEQMGKLKGVSVGPCSDVYGFGKTCCFALFGTAQPTFQHWQSLPPKLAELLGRCLNEQPSARPQSFTELLRELERTAEAPPAPTPAPAKPAPAKPVAKSAKPAADEPPLDDLPEVDEKPAARSASKKSTKEQKPVTIKRRPRHDLDRTHDSGSLGSAVGWLVLGGLAVMCVVMLGLGGLLLFGSRVKPTNESAKVQPKTELPIPPLLQTPTPTPTPPPPVQTKKNPVQPPVLQPPTDNEPPIPPLNTITSLEVMWAPDLSGVAPISTAQFPAVLAELQSKPSLARLRILAGRLIKTPPTAAQKEKHANFKNTASGEERERLKKEDDISQVALALQPLIDQKDVLNSWYGVTACQTWGTSDNVPGLIALFKVALTNADAVRIGAAKALGAIGDPRGIDPVMARLADDAWDNTRGVVDGAVAFGPKAESAVWPYLRQPKSAKTRTQACHVLEKIGTEKSIPVLEEMMTDSRVANAARNAITAIRKRGG